MLGLNKYEGSDVLTIDIYMGSVVCIYRYEGSVGLL